MNEYIAVLKKYAVFSGRSARKEFWLFTLINVVIMVILGYVDSAAGLTTNGSGILSGLYGLAVFIPSLAVSIRRLHDTGRSGSNLFWIILPIIGDIILLVYLVMDSQPGDNKYGPNPKAAKPAAPAVPVAPPPAPPAA